MLTTTATYRMIASDLTKSLGRTADTPTVARNTDHYLDKIGDVKSIDDFLADDRLYAYAMEAFGLGEMTYAKAFMRKVLVEGVDDKKAFANRLADTRYREFAQVFNFKRYGEATTAFDRTQQGTVDRYVRQALEKDAGQQNEGVRLALYFERKAPKLQTTLEVLADPALLKVVQTALGISPSTSAADIDKQVALIEKRLNVKDLADPAKLEKFLTRFTSLWELTVQPAMSASPAILFGRPIEAGVNPGLLQSLQNLKIGGA